MSLPHVPKGVGRPFAPLAAVRRKDFAWTRGQSSTCDSSPVAVRYFCSACGTPLGFAYTGSDWIDVTTGSLDVPAEAPPRKHYGIENRVPWFESIVALPGEKTEDSMEAELQRALINFQHPDHDTADDWTPPEPIWR